MHPVTQERRGGETHQVIAEVKTMARDLKTSQTLSPETKEGKKRWWSFKRTKTEKEVAPPKNTPPQQDSHDLASSWHAPEVHHQVTEATHAHHQAIDIPTEADRAQKSPYRSRFMRGIAKKGYLTSKLSIELPFHAKAGIGIALLVLVVGLPVLSRFMAKPAPVTAGTVVAMGTEALVAQVARSIELPMEESPLVVIATADDIRRLNVPDSKPGDKVLIYQKTGKIVVYDAEKDKVLGVVNRSQP
jgi:hypothetical protein